MELKQYFGLLWRWAWLIILGAIVAASIAFVVTYFTQPVYSASTTVLINQAPSDKAADLTSLNLSERLAQTYVQMLTKRPVLEEVIQQLGLSTSPAQLGSRVKVTAVTNTQLIVIQVENEDPVLAASLANLIPEVFDQQNDALQATRYAAAEASLVAELNSLTQQVQDKQSAILNYGSPESEVGKTILARLQSDLTQLRQSYTGTLQSYQDVLLAKAQSTSNIQVVEPAQVPVAPVRPKPLQTTVLWGVIGLLGAVGLAFLIEHLDDSLRSPEQLSKLLAAPVIGVVGQMNGQNKSAGRERSLLAVEEPRSPIVEAFRTLRTNIQFAGVDRPIRSLLITSAGPTEGKSTVSSNLAVVMAQAGLRVVLVDGDLRRPSIHKIFNLPNRLGITNLMLQASSQWDAAAQATQIPNLSIISTGSLPPNPSELLGSERFRQFLDRLINTYDLVIVDSPPLLAVTDAAIIARSADAALLVIDTGSTRAGAVTQSKEQLSRVGARVLGAVMNKFTVSRSGYSPYYQYYQYYYYGNSSKGSSQGNGKNGHKSATALKQTVSESPAPTNSKN